MPHAAAGNDAPTEREALNRRPVLLAVAVATFFLTSSLASAVMGRLVEQIGAHRGMRLAAAGSAASLLGVALLARSWAGLIACLILGGLANAVSHPAANLSLAREV